MRAIPEDLNLDSLVGQTLNQICVGAYDLQFRFEELLICCEGSVSVGEIEGKSEIFTNKGWKDSSPLMRLAGQKIVGWKKESSHLLSIHLGNGSKIYFESEDSPWENFVINLGESVW